jgi:hypothetical protein
LSFLSLVAFGLCLYCCRLSLRVPLIPTSLYGRYGGLKKFLENQPMLILGSDHQFNPHTYLRDFLDKDELARVLNGERVFPRRLEGLVSQPSCRSSNASSSKQKSKKQQQPPPQQHTRIPSTSSQGSVGSVSNDVGSLSPPLTGLEVGPSSFPSSPLDEEGAAHAPTPVITGTPPNQQSTMFHDWTKNALPDLSLGPPPPPSSFSPSSSFTLAC